MCPLRCYPLAKCLKREDTRLRDWNFVMLNCEIARSILEKRRYSIPRLKHIKMGEIAIAFIRTWKEKILDYEIETCHNSYVHLPNHSLKREDTRLRDWNLPPFPIDDWVKPLNLKREDTRLRDWNILGNPVPLVAMHAWKEKILDYEIETPSSSVSSAFSDLLEKRRYSITRLKRESICLPTHSLFLTWKEKILDYEIETRSSPWTM